jgi:hypothetical protein
MPTLLMLVGYARMIFSLTEKVRDSGHIPTSNIPIGQRFGCIVGPPRVRGAKTHPNISRPHRHYAIHLPVLSADFAILLELKATVALFCCGLRDARSQQVVHQG